MSNAIADQMPNNGPDRYERMFKDMQGQIDQLRAARTLDKATITALAGLGIRTGDFDGTDFAHPGTAGNYFGGDGCVLNNLYLRPGSVGNDALTNPSAPQAFYDWTTNFGVPATLTNLRTLTIPVPTGYTKAAVQLTVRIYAINNTAGLDYLYSQANINGYNGLAMPVAASATGGSCMNVSTFSAVLGAGTLGSNLVLQAAGQTSFGAWATSTSNQLDLSGTVIWYR